MVQLAMGYRTGRLALIAALSCAASGCGDDGASGGSSAVAQAYDRLTASVSACAEELRTCSKSGTASVTASCRDAYRKCQQEASEAADSPLRAAIDSCQNADQECRESEGDAGPLVCSQSLRRCIGEPAQPKPGGKPPLFDTVNPDAPTYQCFGQLRECATSGEVSKSCSAQARDCVVVAIGRLEERTPLRAADDAKAGEGGSSASAGRGGDGGGATTAGRGSEPSDAGARQERPECKAGYDACVGAGGKQGVCMRARVECEEG